MGRVDAIAASTGEENLGEDKYVLLARVRFEPTDDDAGIPHNGAGGYVAPVDALQLAVADGRMELRDLGWTSTDASVPPLDVWPVMYDYDNDDLIGLGDLSYFASAYGKAADDPASPYGEASDFDHSGHIDLGDLSYFAANYRRTPEHRQRRLPARFPRVLAARRSRRAGGDGNGRKRLGRSIGGVDGRRAGKGGRVGRDRPDARSRPSLRLHDTSLAPSRTLHERVIDRLFQDPAPWSDE